MTIEDMENTPRICAALEGQEVDHQSIVVEVRRNIFVQIVSTLIEPGACYSYISPRTIEICKLNNTKHKIPWIVQLETSGKRKISKIVQNCQKK